MSQTRSATLVHVDADGIDERLAAAWYSPRERTDIAFLHLHGKGGNFYTGPGLFVPLHDDTHEFAHLSLNMRCHDLGYTRYDVPMPDVTKGHVQVAGGMWEQLSSGHVDVAAGVSWLREQGHTRIFLVGHSSGAYYALESSADHGIDVAGVVLLSSVISYKRHLNAWFAEGLDVAVDRARSLVARGEGHRLMPIESWYYAISAVSLLERVDQDDDAFEQLLERNAAPVMFVCGDAEARLPQWREQYDRVASDRKQWLVLSGASHDYIGAEGVLTEEILRFARHWA